MYAKKKKIAESKWFGVGNNEFEPWWHANKWMHFFNRKVEMETKRKMEEIERRRQEDEDLRAAVALQVI